jgi:hypothetical protein
MTDAPHEPAAAPDDAVPDGLPCVRCGYALTALPTDGDCPECGTEIATSLAGDRIADADPRWLDLLQHGLRLLALGTMTALVAFCAFALILVASILIELVTVRPAAVELVTELVLTGLSWTIPIGFIAAAVGGWLVTTAEPRDAELEQPRDARPIARWGPALAVGCGVTAAILRSTLPAPHDLIGPWIAGLGVPLGAGLGLAALAERFRQLVIRVPDVALADRASTERTWFRRATRTAVVAVAARLTMAILTVHAPGVAGSVWVQLVDAVASLVILFLVIAGITHAARLAKVGSALRLAIRETRSGGTPGTPATSAHAGTDPPP